MDAMRVRWLAGMAVMRELDLQIVKRECIGVAGEDSEVRQVFITSEVRAVAREIGRWPA